MHKLRKLKNQLLEELEELAGDGDMNTAKLARIDTLSHALKNLTKVMSAMDASEEENNSYRGNSMGGRSMRRDSYRDGDRRGYSRDDGKDELIDHLKGLMETADDRSRMALEHCISQVESA